VTENEKQFKQFMQPRLFGIVATVDNPKDASDTFPMRKQKGHSTLLANEH
jgi:hypothetical protein